MPRSAVFGAMLMLATAPLAAGPAAAQAPAVVASLERWRDSLAVLDDTSAVLRLEGAIKAAARDGGAVARLRHGLLQQRLGELGKWHRFGAAVRTFRGVARREPRWPYPLYAAALAKAAESDALRRNPLNIGKRAGVGALEDAVALLGRAVDIDPTFAPALAALGRLPFRLRDRAIWRTALAALRSRSAGALAPPEVFLAVGRIEREVGTTDSALAAFHAYLAAGGRPGLGRLELARTRFAAELPGAEDDYYAGAAEDDSATVAEYRADLAVIFPDSVLAEFDAARGAARARVLRRFWADRDAVELREPGERLREHYRRLFHARRHYAISTTKRVYWPGSGCTVRTGSLEYDDRGIVYIRHGEPTEVVRTYLHLVMPNESWRYDRADGRLLFHFGAGSDPYDYRLLASVLDLYGGCAGPFWKQPRDGAAQPWDVALSREHLDPIYAEIGGGWGSARAGALLRAERRLGEASIAIGTTTESHELRFPTSLPVAVRTVVVGRDGARSLAHVVFAIPGEATRPDSLAAGLVHPVRLRFVAYDGRGRVVARRDTAARYVTRTRVRPGEFLYGRFEVPVPPGTWTYRAAVQYGDSAGAVLPRDSMRAGDFGGGRLAISDLVVGWREVALTWRGARADTVYFSPFSAYYDDTELELYYEVYGTRPGEPLRTELVVTPVRGRARPLRLAFDEVAAADITAGRRTLGLAALRPGRYHLELVVTDAAGRSERRRTQFEVQQRPVRRR